MDSSSIESFKLDLIKQINKYRNNHGASNLKNDSKIDKIAQKFSEQLAKKGKLDYSYNQYNGEDLGESVYKSEIYLAPLKLAKALYDENSEYNYKSKDPEPSNFTQMVWKDSELLGFGMSKSSNGKYFYVINYYPTGNVDGEFKKNVFPPGTQISNTSKKINSNKENNNDIHKKPEKKETYVKREYHIKESFDNNNNKPNKNNENKNDFKKMEEKFKKKFENFFKNDDDFFNKFDDDDDEDFKFEYPKTQKKIVKEEIKTQKKDNKDTKLDILTQLINNKKKEKEKDISNKKNNEKIIEKPSSQIESTSDFNDFCLDALDAHNHYRKIHHVQPVKLNKDLCRIAQNYSKKLGNEIGHLEHSENCYNGDTLGENLFFCYGCEPTGTSVSKNWYGENKKYDYSGGWRSGTGHFTQMIWKETKEVGFGKYKNKKGQYYVVGNYYPAGNVIGFFKYNVFRP